MADELAAGILMAHVTTSTRRPGTKLLVNSEMTCVLCIYCVSHALIELCAFRALP